jgi:hypothetical protein
MQRRFYRREAEKTEGQRKIQRKGAKAQSHVYPFGRMRFSCPAVLKVVSASAALPLCPSAVKSPSVMNDFVLAHGPVYD